MADDAKRRKGLRPPFRRDDLDALARAEANMARALRDPSVKWRRLGDAAGVTRIPDWSTVRVRDFWGPVVLVRGFAPDGNEDHGLRCTDCPVSDLEPVGDEENCDA